jgi:FtsP/CotA-like multicopper oxidase with cupredoxin domain
VTITRRRALGLATVGAAGLAAGSAGWALRGGGSADRLTPAAGSPLPQPTVLDSRAGRLQVELVVAPGARVAGQDTVALAYNGQIPGPTLRVRPGDELALRLTNRLGRPTNLHTHGLRVSPAGNSDNPFVRVEPGASFDYLITIPRDHPPGTHWYHPHQHELGAEQQWAGLTGTLLVVPPGGASDVADIADDLVLMVTDMSLHSDGTLAAPGSAARSVGREGDLVLVNGQFRPTVAGVVGERARWRLVNASTSRVLALRLEGHALTQVAQDGSLLEAPIERDRVVLAPGNRVDVVVRADRVGSYPLIADTYDRGRVSSHTTARAPATVAEFVVGGARRSPHPSTKVAAPAPPRTQPLPAATRTRHIAFTTRRADRQLLFDIDHREFDHARDDQTVALGTTEDWVITNEGPLDHPFHLHTWPFLVLATSDGAPRAGVLQDVVLVPARGWARVRIPFTANPGRSVYHCHIVDHADTGMMATVVVR